MECLNEVLARNVRNIPDKVFIITDTETVTYAEFDRRVSRLANVLRAHGAKKGDPVGLYIPGDLRMTIGFWACQKLGAIPVPTSAMYRETELRNAIGLTGMPVLIASDETLPLVEKVRGDYPTLKSVLVHGKGAPGRPALADLIAAAPDTIDHVQCLGADIAAMFFTSGTTGVPKAAMQSQFNQWSSLRDMMTYHHSRYASEVYYCAAPLFSNLGSTVTVNLCMFSGGSVVLHERFDTRRVIDSIKQHKVTLMPGTPTMFVYMLNEYDAARDDLTSLRLTTNGGSPVSPVICKRFEEISGAPVLQTYGATETTGQTVLESFYGVRKLGSTGSAIGSSYVLVVDDDGKEVPNGTLGEVIVGGDCMGQGYWKDPEASAKSFTPRGWVSGDLGYLDDEGYLFIVDRKKDIIISGGHNIYPLEVENILYRHPAVAVCALIGVPDEAKGENPVAIIVRKPGSAITGKEIVAFCRENVSAYKAPRTVYFIDEMPMGAGKIRKRELLDAIKAGTLKAAD